MCTDGSDLSSVIGSGIVKVCTCNMDHESHSWKPLNNSTCFVYSAFVWGVPAYLE